MSPKCRSSFAIDFFTFILPIVLYVNVSADSFSTIFAVYLLFIFLISVNIVAIINKKSSESRTYNLNRRGHRTQNETDTTRLTTTASNAAANTREVVLKSIHSLRTMIFVIASVVILAVDLPSFPYEHRKSSQLGMSLMDTGVGFFIMCTSFRVIRLNLRSKNCSNMNSIDDSSGNSICGKNFIELGEILNF